MVDISKIKEDIVKILLCINIISFITSFFTYSKALFIIIILINIILGYTLIIIDKFGDRFESQYIKMWSKK